MQTSEFQGEYIKLNQWLKKENLIPTGGEARHLIEQGAVKVNGVTATELRKKLRDHDVVTIEGAGDFTMQRTDL